MDILPLETWESWSGWLQGNPLLNSSGFPQQFPIPPPPFVSERTSKVKVKMVLCQLG